MLIFSSWRCHAKQQVSSTTPLQPPRRRLSAIPQPGNPLPNTIHHSMSARLKETQLPHHHIVLRQVAREDDIASRAIHLPELPQASRRSAAEACLIPSAFAEATIGIIAASTEAVRRARARSRQRTPPEVRRTSASPSSPFVEHIDVALLLFSAPRPLLGASSSIIARVTRGERLALLLPNHSLESF